MASFSIHYHTDPTLWSKEQVYLWIDWMTKEFGLHSLNSQILKVYSGQQLCSFTIHQFQELSHIKEQGQTLYHFLERLKGFSPGE